MSCSIDNEAFQQLLELDDDDHHEFSLSIIKEFFESTEVCVKTMDQHMMDGNFEEVGKIGHYLKGSAAGIGAAQVRDVCDEIQHYDLIADHKYERLTELILKLKEYVIIARGAFKVRYAQFDAHTTWPKPGIQPSPCCPAHL